MRFCERNDLIDRKSYVAQYVALALFSVGATTLLGSDDLLSAFASGTAFAWDGFFNRQTEDSAFSSVIDLLFNIAAFIYIGAWMPFHLFQSDILTLSVWRLIVLAILVLILRRLPVMLALYKWMPDVKTFREAVFSGHFGPIGVGAIFISTLAVEQLPHANDPPRDQIELLAASIQPIVAFMVLCSITVHGLSIPFFSLGRRVHSVSRTWSRHQSTDLALGPEWTTHTRRVTRAEDIVVNRDEAADVMERGAVGVEEKREVPEEGTEDREKERVERQGQGLPELPRESSAEDQNPPDGDRLPGDVSQWQEGHDLVIERDQGAGEEVEVEVIRNAFNDESPETKHTFRGKRDEIRHVIEKLKEGAGHGAQEVEEGVKNVMSGLTPRHSKEQERNEHDNEREEDWADEEGEGDGENGLESSYSSGAALLKKKLMVSTSEASGSASEPQEPNPARSKSPKPKHKSIRERDRARSSAKKRGIPAFRTGSGSGTRRSRSHGDIDIPRDSSPSPTEHEDDAEHTASGRPRGRDTLPRLNLSPHLGSTSSATPTPTSGSTPVSPVGTVGRTRRGHAQHESISRLRMEGLRAASPARSIRFADEQEPQGSRPVSSQGFNRDGNVSEDAGRVLFDLPEGRRR
ncbi:hypothetical protein M422DRAFT_273866 [Sphaerobolus stellatus SS14]|uniref:Unplaced genomic scaffold SPHSTscaffold_353, whole genome shotgun sequence n=1 Tax=Sphaerobolus stellatus (strain SS14) TaxID=990650 RepID=A0A0C9UIH1_SPHS4|nr:hypothetical protein M422DRAFT_273866 [Sphaerobolus stellatus SS14]